MTRIVNLTPHAIRLRMNELNMDSTPDETDVVIPPENEPARVSTRPGHFVRWAGGVPIHTAPTYGGVEGLPLPQDDTLYVVSQMVAQRFPMRDDVVCTGTGPADNAVRDRGMVYAVTRLIRGG